MVVIRFKMLPIKLQTNTIQRTWKIGVDEETKARERGLMGVGTIGERMTIGKTTSRKISRKTTKLQIPTKLNHSRLPKKQRHR